MNIDAALPVTGKKSLPPTRAQDPVQARARRRPAMVSPIHLSSHATEPENSHQAETFYLQKQIQSQTPMVVVLEDGEQIEGCIEWYDRNTLKVRGRSKTLVYKSAIKYMYKVGDSGQ